MSYRNKTYVIFNANYPENNGDIKYYNLMIAWKENKKIDFNFYDSHKLNNLRKTASEDQIKRKLRERMRNSKQVIVLVGEHTKNLYKFVRWEIEIAIDMDLPIIAVNLDKKDGLTAKTPPILRKKIEFVSVPFEAKKVKHALDTFPKYYNEVSSLPVGLYYTEVAGVAGLYYDWSEVTF